MQCAGFIVVPECGGCRVISQPMLPLHFKAAVLTEMISERLVSDLHILYASSQFICGPKYENGEWKSRTNRELEEMSK